MRSLEEHRAAILAGHLPLPARSVPTLEGLGLVLAAAVTARADLPGFDNSAMDGYAVRAADVAGASAESPVTLPVDGDIAAGDTTRHTLAPGHTMRIMTGAPTPEGADAIVPVEASDGGVEVAALTQAAVAGQHLRRRGEDVQVGQVLLEAGRRLDPGRIALVTAANVPTVSVVPVPRVAIWSTGDELRPAGSSLEHGQIVDSNGPMLAALVRAAGAQVAELGHLPDDAESVRSALLHPPDGVDVLLTTGGVSMGAYDTVKEVLREQGVEFAKVAMRPGMPQGHGRVGPHGIPVITLPGNPVSSLVSFHMFVAPLLRLLAGREPLADGRFEAVADTDWPSVAGKVDCTRVVVDGGRVRPSGGQGSHQLGAMADADALALVPPEVAAVTAGMSLWCVPLLGTGTMSA